MKKKKNEREVVRETDAEVQTPEEAKRSEPIETYDLGGLPDDATAQKEITADQRSSSEAIYQAKQRILRARRSGPDGPLGRLASIEAELKNRTHALQILSAPKPKSPDNDLLIHQLTRAVGTGNTNSTMAAKIRRDTLSLFASLDSSDAIESILNRHIVTMSNGAMECQARAVVAGDPKSFDVFSRHAEKMTRVVIDLIETRERRRRPKQVVVGNVNVEAGGQAIVGTVEAHKPRPRSDDDPSDDSA